MPIEYTSQDVYDMSIYEHFFTTFNAICKADYFDKQPPSPIGDDRSLEHQMVVLCVYHEHRYKSRSLYSRGHHNHVVVTSPW